EIFILTVGAHVHKWQNRNPLLIKLGGKDGLLLLPRHRYLEHFNWFVHVPQRPWSEALKRKVELVFHLIVDFKSKTHSSIFCKSLDSRCNVHSIARNVVFRLDHVAEVDAHAAANPLVSVHREVEFSYLPLYVIGAPRRIQRAQKFDKECVSNGLHLPSVVFVEHWPDDLPLL